MIEQFHIEKGIPLPRPRIPRPPNVCKWCSERQREEGYKTCRPCRESVRAIYFDKKRRGICAYGSNETCSELADPGHVTCSKHRKQNSDRIRRLLDGRVAQGLCRRCGKPRFADDKTWCAMCRVAQGYGPLPPKTRRLIRQFWRLDRIDQRRQYAERAVSLLPERLGRIISLRQGLIDGVDHTLESIGDQLGITRERVRQIESKAYAALVRKGFNVDPLRSPQDLQRPALKSRSRKLSRRQRRKEKARQAVTEALRKGDLKRQPCEKCGHSDKVIAHHPDYSKPLEVQWLCHRHHAQAHGKQLRPIKPPQDAPAWLIKAGTPSSELFDAPAIVSTLKALWIKQGQIQDITGLSRQTILRIVKGQEVGVTALARMLRYVENLKQQNEQAA